MGEEAYTLSQYVQILRIDDSQAVVGNPFRLQRLVLSTELADFLQLFQGEARALSQLRELVDAPPQAIEGLVEFFRSKGLIVLTGLDETATLGSELRRLLDKGNVDDVQDRSRLYHAPIRLEASRLRPRYGTGSLTPLTILVLGGCFTQFTADALEESGANHGFDVRVETGWPGDVDMIERIRPEVVVLQVTTTWLLAPLWDEAPFLDDNERERRLEALKNATAVTVQKVLDQCAGRLLLLQGFSTPQISPLGITEFRHRCNFQRIVYELNTLLAELARDNPNVLLVDEERLAANSGRSRLLDDGIVPFSHHAPIDFCCGPIPPGPSREETWSIQMACHLPRLLAAEYLDLYILWSGRWKIKCVVVDLDNTLWPGVVGETGFSLKTENSFQALRYGPFGGLHQALKILKHRGVLLATCSKNNPSDVASAWESLRETAKTEGMSHLLLPEDFVLHKVNWKPKSQNVGELISELGIGEDAVLFIDDNPIERAEVSAALPSVRVLGDNLHRVRAQLLSDPCLQNNVASHESQRRTETTLAQLTRETARRQAPDEASFLRSLEIRLQVKRVRSSAHVPRLVELLQRTNQFNTTLKRHDADQMRSFLFSEAARVYTLEAQDRFTSYGVVGLCIIAEQQIDTLLLSCRVLGLQPAIPFLVTVLNDVAEFPITGTLVEGPRNQPSRDVYRLAGFSALGGGRFIAEQASALTAIDQSIYLIDLIHEASPEPPIPKLQP
ncbi:HAD-IIIC family phosphatase [Stigmatella sp. ncwal1]|uniref:HAD-IIIC family phosphatase n=1 Tax=Stigmatella ashevillensis TaxID=2995309 RepID=A0ABT5D3M6_9BACT|nr:HAD-IIIC family phosphatase [Stigmatella ashevillena]MDC0708262.1 HAD-IIIC family phosphatase [Stigmatella ashevillena]